MIENISNFYHKLEIDTSDLVKCSVTFGFSMKQISLDGG